MLLYLFREWKLSNWLFDFWFVGMSIFKAFWLTYFLCHDIRVFAKFTSEMWALSVNLRVVTLIPSPSLFVLLAPFIVMSARRMNKTWTCPFFVFICLYFCVNIYLSIFSHSPNAHTHQKRCISTFLIFAFSLKSSQTEIIDSTENHSPDVLV